MNSFSTKPKSERTLRRHAQFAVQQAIENLAQQCCDKNLEFEISSEDEVDSENEGEADNEFENSFENEDNNEFERYYGIDTTDLQKYLTNWSIQYEISYVALLSILTVYFSNLIIYQKMQELC